MPGFFLTNFETRSADLNVVSAGPMRRDCQVVDEWLVARAVLDRFPEHKVFSSEAHAFVMTDGVITNAHRLGLGNRSLASWLLEKRQENQEFFGAFRGSFSGAIYDREKKEWLVYADAAGGRPIFYWEDPARKRVIVGSQMNFVTDFMKQMSVERNPDPHGFQFLFNYGNFVDTHTGVEGVRRLYPGDYLVIRDGRVQVRTFYRLKTTAQNRVPVDEAISRLEKAFHQALSDAVYWNERHSYGCIVDLGAGADTRMMAFAMHRLKPEMLEFMTYAQTRSRDHRVAGQIAEYLHCPWTFMAMDDPSFLTEIDDLAIMNNGVSFYYGITGGKKTLEKRNPTDVGTELTGVVGDVFEGAMLTEGGNELPNPFLEHFRLSDRFPMEKTYFSDVADSYQDNSSYWTATRGFMAAVTTNSIRQHYVDTLTPFADIDFLEACFSIPWKQRVEERVQFQWLKKEFPESLRFQYSGTGMPLRFATWPGANFLHKVINTLGVLRAKFFGGPYRGDMNPLNFWWDTQEDLRKRLTEYYRANLHRVKEESTREKTRRLFEESNRFSERGLALSLLAYYKNYLD